MSGSRATAGLTHLLPRVLGIVGAGQLGTGIADLSSRAGFDKILLFDSSSGALHNAEQALKRSLKQAIAGNKLTKEHADGAQASISYVNKLQHLQDSQFVIEAIPEDEFLKKNVFSSLDKICDPAAILSSNTSSISITRLAAATARPERVIGMHFMNPPLEMDLLELVGGRQTSAEVYQTAQVLALHLKKTVCFSADRPGFIVNRLLMPMVNEAFFALMEGVANADDIDLGMQKSTHMPMGPLRWADFVGLDNCLNIMRVLHTGLGEDKYRPCPLLQEHVDAGWLGVKTGRGVYLYPDRTHKSAISPGVSPPPGAA